MYKLQSQDLNLDESQILKHYQLDVLDPVVWTEEPDNRHSRRFSIIDGQLYSNNIAVEERQSFNDSDPLGLRPSIFSNNEHIQRVAQGDYEFFKEQSQLFISSKSFNSKVFLRTVHLDTSYADLLVGAQKLRFTLDQKAEALKKLVHDNFDGFVSAKNTIDTVYNEMKAKSLNEKDDFGIRSLDVALTDAAVKAEQVFGPVLANRTKAEKIRSTLSVLEKFKFFFSLPSSLTDTLKHQNYEMVIRDYKKGRVVMESTLSPESSDSANGMTERETTEDTALAAQYRKVFEKVWAEVERIMAEMKEQLLKQLTEPWRPLDDQERTINILLELDIPDDPVWHYLDSQYNYITNLFKETYKEQVAKIEALKKSVITNDVDKRQVANNLKDTIKIISTRNFDALTARKSMDVQIWQATLVIVKTLSDLLLRCLPDFWKLSKSFAEGKFQKNQTVLSTNRRRRQAMDLDKVKEAQKMAKGVIDLYAQLLSDFFNLSSSTEDQNGTSESVQSPSSISFVPPQSDSVVACYFLTKIVMEMCECVNDINAINVAAEATVALSTLMEQTRWRFVGVLCDTWINDATNFYLLEDWTLDSDNREITTILRTFHTFHKYNSRCAFKIASLGFVSDTDESKGGPSIPPEYLERIKGAFFRSIEAYLDSLPDIASDAAVERVDNKANESIFRPRIDPTDSEATLLLTVSNLASLKQYMIPRLVSQFENAYKCKMAAEVSSINEYVDQLDEIFFADYIRLKKEAVSEIIRKGILNSGIDWYNIAKPTEVHAFVYEALLTLVMVHSQISDVSKILVNRALSELLDSMVQDCYDAFGQVERFGMGGMLQAVLDIKVMDQILAQYATPKAQEIFTNIYKKIEELYDPSQRTGNLETELNSVRGLLVTSLQNTGLQFLCFKKSK